MADDPRVKFVRLAALFGSIVLIVATTVTMIEKRSDSHGRQDDRVAGAALVVTQSAQATIDRAKALTDLAATTTSVEAVDLGALTRSIEGAQACVVNDIKERCSGPSLTAAGTYDRARQLSQTSGGLAVAVADPTSNSVVVVADGAVQVVMDLPSTSLLSPKAKAALVPLDATGTVVLTDSSKIVVVGPRTVNGSRVLAASTPLDDGVGSLLVTASVVDDVGLVGGSFALYAVLLGLGTVLIGLAGWTFLAERRTLERRATTDELTGLANRREFERLTEEALLEASRFGTGVCIMLVDLNGFKQINDTLGHQFGDLVLQACAERLTNAVRETDIVGRWGGDEFVILLPGVEDGSAVRAAADRIATKLSSTPVAGDVSMSGSIGAALYPRHGDDLDELVRAADLAMYEAKSTGVSHRLADRLSLEDARETSTDSYRGPDRRRHPSDVDSVR
jgi:diguanylate cyclase (GGDEF)-like protein